MGVNAKNFEGRSAFRDMDLEGIGAPATGGIVDLGMVRARGRLRRILVGQRSAGVAGTSFSVAIKRLRKGSAAVDLLGTAPVVTLAAGDGTTVDTSPANDAPATPAGCTKPVLSAVAGRLDVEVGDHLYAVVTLTGAYTTNPTVSVIAAIAPNL